MNRESFDALFVLNQDADWVLIKKAITQHNVSSVLFLTSHYLYPTEQDRIREILPNVKWKTIDFGNCLSDSVLVECDKAAYHELLKEKTRFPDFVHVFVKWLHYYKNKEIFEEISQRYEFGKIFYWATKVARLNLGISADYWQSKGGKNLIPFNYYLKKRTSRWLSQSILGAPLHRILTYLKTLFDNYPMWVVEHGKEQYIFSSLRRISFIEGVSPREIQYRPLRFFNLVRSNNRAALYDRFILSLIKKGNHTHPATPLHRFSDFYQIAGETKRETFIFEDAFRPTNYPPYYYVHYFPFGTIICRDMYDYQLFSSNGKTVRKPLPFLEKGYFSLPSNDEIRQPKTIILSLNHAGDWSSLINRTDTDILIENLCQLAPEFPDKTFIIRLHPTMTEYNHEGKGSVRRIWQMVQERGIANLSVSNVTLEEDWKRGDIFIAEHSLSVIDAMRKGKLGFFANLTNRRSFVQDYIELGFLCAQSREDMVNIINGMLQNPAKYKEQQNESMKTYNTLLSSFLNEDS